MFQDIEPRTYNNDFAWIDPEPTDCVLIYRGSSVLASVEPDETGASPSGATLRYPRYRTLEEAHVVGPEAAAKGMPKADGSHPLGLLLFTVGDTAYFRCEVDETALEAFLATPESPWRFVPIPALHQHTPRHRAFAGMVGYEYHVWYDTRRFCGRCGTPLVHDLVERMVRCPQCGCMEFPKLFPAVIVGIVDPSTDRVLVSRYANRAYKRFALIAGFCELGETVEQTVHREVMEEVGLRVKNLRYYASQPWPPSSSLLFGFFCELDGDATITLDHHELEHAEWIDRADLPREDADYSLTRDMMRVLREGREAEATA